MHLSILRNAQVGARTELLAREYKTGAETPDQVQSRAGEQGTQLIHFINCLGAFPVSTNAISASALFL